MTPEELIASAPQKPSKKFRLIVALAVAVVTLAIVSLYASKGKQSTIPASPAADIEKRMQENQVPPLTPAEQVAIEKKMSGAKVPVITAEEKATIEKRMSGTIVPQ